MPDSNPDLMRIFAESLERSNTGERTAYLERACAGNKALRSQVEELLAAHVEAGRILEHNPHGVTAAFEPCATGVLADHGSDVATGTFGGTAGEPATVGHVPGATAGAAIGAKPLSLSMPIIPGFEIVEELGHGGMGVVYKAMQAGLNRPVALKVLVAGPYASPTLRARFLLEAESVAALEHPYIIRVFAFGDAGGHPYLAMEFIPGGTLADRIKQNGSLSARNATELVAMLAGAVAHAHSRGVVHRDIKPLNVLLTTEGEPRLTDFGLAKVGRLERNLSVTGQVLGTPAYMAPEQAAGKVHEVGTAADVYALGAVLYDALTGRPPFQGDSAAATLQKVLTEEPQRPRKLNPAVPRDVETICLKCLEKQPTRRYPTALTLADDLLRYLHNEPIEARPTGALERGWKWAIRNKVAAGAAMSVTLALVVGAGVSLGFGLEAQKQKKDAEGAAAREEQEKRAAIAARNELQVKNDELIRSRERINRTLAKAILGPISGKNRKNPLTAYEAETFWQLADLRRENVSVAFFEEATQTPLTSAQLECRAEYAMHAAIGLDVSRRTMVDQLYLSRLKEQPAGGSLAVSLALSISRSDFISPETAAVAARLLTDALTQETDSYQSSVLASGLAAVAAKMEPSQAVRLLTDTLNKQQNTGAFEMLEMGLVAIASRMKPAQAARTLTEALYEKPGWLWQKGLMDTAARMKPAEAARTLSDALKKTASLEIANGLVAVLKQLSPAEAAQASAQVARTLTDALNKEMSPYTRSVLAGSLAALAEWMEPGEAFQVCARAARILSDELIKEMEVNDRIWIANSLARVTARMEPAEAVRTLIDALIKEKDRIAGNSLATGLAAVTARLKPGEAAIVCAKAASILKDKLNKDENVNTRNLAIGLAAVVARMEPAEAANVCSQAARTLIDALNEEINSDARNLLATDLAAVMERMEPAEAASILTGTLDKETDSLAHSNLAASLVAVAKRMEPAEAARTLTNALNKEKNVNACCLLATGLAAVTARLKPGEAAKVCAQVARLLTDTLKKETGGGARLDLAVSLEAVVTRMEPDEAARFCAQAARIFSDAINEEMGELALLHLGTGLAKVGQWMEPAEAARMLTDSLYKQKLRPGISRALAQGLAAVAAQMQPAEAARILTEALNKEFSGSAHPELVQGLAAVAERMEPAEAVRTLTNALNKEKYDRDSLARGLATVASRMESSDAARILANALDKEVNWNARYALSTGLMTIAARMKPAEAVRAITDALNKEISGNIKSILARRLTDVAAGVEPVDAAHICAQAARTLTEALSKEGDANTRVALATGLASVATRMELIEAARILTDAFNQEGLWEAKAALVHGLAAIAERMEPVEAAQVCAQTARNLNDGIKFNMGFDMGVGDAVEWQVRGLAAIAARMEPSQAALTYIEALGMINPLFLTPNEIDHTILDCLVNGLAEATLGHSAHARARHVLVIFTGAAPQNILSSLPVLHPHFHPQPKLLPPHELVELLKHPFCIGEARQIVLVALGSTYNRTFKDQWEFVEYAQKHQPQLDLFTPPKRPTRP